MAQFHFVEDYERHVASLIANHPIDEAMSLAVGGGYNKVGAIEAHVMRYAGLRDGMSLMDLGCGSGRLAWALGESMKIEYTGIDIVQSLLDYAKSKSPPNYQFLWNQELSLPAPDQSLDFMSVFSVFTHLLHAESYIYMEEARRALKPGGKLVFSFLEFFSPHHWAVFEATVAPHRNKIKPLLNTFIERPVIEIWCKHLGLALEEFIGSHETRWDGDALGQSVAIIRKP